MPPYWILWGAPLLYGVDRQMFFGYIGLLLHIVMLFRNWEILGSAHPDCGVTARHGDFLSIRIKSSGIYDPQHVSDSASEKKLEARSFSIFELNLVIQLSTLGGPLNPQSVSFHESTLKTDN